MEEDGSLTPGSKAFWDHFYNDEEGRLVDKESHHRRATEIKEGGSLLDHYEWFMEYPRYGPALIQVLEQELKAPARSDSAFHVLHVGCGNSNFCDHFVSAMSLSSSFSSTVCSILNTDICENIISHLSTAYPDRLYAVGNCCNLRSSEERGKTNEQTNQHLNVILENNTDITSGWYRQHVSFNGTPELEIMDNTVHLIFDKGTLDALLSAFPGEYNPNVLAYAEESVRVLKTGALWYIISINAVDVVDSYVLAVCDAGKSFRRVSHSSIELSSQETNLIRVETLGSRYLCYGYLVVEED